MPTERYMRLSAEKKQIICNAAFQEFARVSFDKVSINKIVQKANISRGSFYTYFEDKQDVLLTVCEERREMIDRVCRDSMEASGGDLFLMATDVFDFFIKRCENKELFELAKNIASCQDIQGMFTQSYGKKSHNGAEILAGKMWDRFHFANLKIQKREDYDSLFFLVIATLAMAVTRYYSEPDHLDEIRHQLSKQLEFIKYGALSEEKNA